MANVIPPNHIENGREFHGYRKGLYMFPCDETEKERLDIAHSMFCEAFNGLHTVPLVEPDETDDEQEPVRILDVGCGTGIWAIEMADKYKRAEVTGLDLVNNQPRSIPPNVRFRIPRDFEGIWTMGADSFDLIYLRMALGAIQSWREMYAKILEHLKPGTGYLEHIEINYEPRRDDGPVPPNLVDWWNYISDACDRGGKPLRYDPQLPALLKVLGFVDVQETIIMLPLCDWPEDPMLKGLGRWNSAVFSDGVEALTLAPLTRVYRWPVDDVKKMINDVTRTGLNWRNRCYQTAHRITARKP